MVKLKIYTLALSVLALFAAGCKKIDKLTQFDLEYNSTIIVAKSTGINLPFNVFTPDMETRSESQFAVNDTRKDLVEKILLTRLRLSLTSPNDSDLDFLKSIEIFIDADGLDERLIAWKNDIPMNVGKVIELDLGGTDLKEYIKKDEFNLRCNTVTRKVLTRDHELNVNSVFFFDAKVLGQ